MNFAIFDEVSPIIPNAYNVAMLQPDKSKLGATMRTEIESHTRIIHGHLSPDQVPKDANIIDLRWVYNRKFDRNGNKTIHKSRLVAKGFSQIQGIDYDETYSPVVKWTTIRFILNYVAMFNLPVHTLDVNTAYLNGNIDKDIYTVNILDLLIIRILNRFVN